MERGTLILDKSDYTITVITGNGSSHIIPVPPELLIVTLLSFMTIGKVIRFTESYIVVSVTADELAALLERL